MVDLKTIDTYCAENRITNIDILRIDTQGFELEILNRAKTFLEENKIHIITTEIIFSEMYEKLPRHDETISLLANHGFKLVTFYPQYYKDNRLSWTDALFINDSFSK